jgi:hypothetical protein
VASKEQHAANRRNAQKSTGPRSDAGKRRSAENAMTHGVYAQGGVAVPRGPFREDPAELQDFITGIADCLGPRDAIEIQQAHLIGGLYNRIRRHDRYEAHALAADGATAWYHEHLEREIEQRQRHVDWAPSIAAAMRGESAEACPWGPEIAQLLVEEANGGNQLWVQGRWTEDRQPQDGAEWRQAVIELAGQIFGTPQAADRWATQYVEEQRAIIEERVSLLLEAAATRSLAGTLATASSMLVRLGHQLEGALRCTGPSNPGHSIRQRSPRMRRTFPEQRRTKTCHEDPGPNEVTRWDKPRSHQGCVSRNEPNHRPGLAALVPDRQGPPCKRPPANPVRSRIGGIRSQPS